ncbi:hypothetical protein HDV62DRAFT_212264 [Trichoderma sp. SZMC 28011]
MCQGFCFPRCPIAGRADARMRRLKPHPRFSRFLFFSPYSSLVNIPILYKTNSLTRRTLLYIHPYLAASCICRLPTKPSTSYYCCLHYFILSNWASPLHLVLFTSPMFFSFVLF